jgi:hypothetical protein
MVAFCVHSPLRQVSLRAEPDQLHVKGEWTATRRRVMRHTPVIHLSYARVWYEGYELV